jgi:hypothetical protein
MASDPLENYPGLGLWIVMQTFRDTESVYRGITEEKVSPFPVEVSESLCLSHNLKEKENDQREERDEV